MFPRLMMIPFVAVGLLVGALTPSAAQESTVDSAPRSLPAGLEAFLQARLFESEDRIRDAMEAYDRALREDPSVVEVRVGYANLLFHIGMPDRAVELLEGTEELDWHGRKIYALALAQLATQDTDRMEDAEKALQDVLDERDDDPNLWLALGQLLHRMGRIDGAERAIAELRKNRPGSPQLVAYHATLLRQLGRKGDAAELFLSCAANAITADSCRDSAAELLIELDRPGEAADLLLEGLQDDDLDELMRTAFLLWEAGRPNQALKVVERVLREVPDSQRGRTLRAHLLSVVGRYPEAEKVLRSLLKKDPTDLDLKLSLAWAVANLGELDEARRWLDRAWEQVASDAASANAIRCAVSGARIELVSDNPLVAREWLVRVSDPGEAGEEYVRLLAESYRKEEDWKNGISAMVRMQPRLVRRARVTAEAIEAEFRLRNQDPRAWQRLRPALDSDDVLTVLMGLQVLQSVERWSDSEREAAAALERFPQERGIMFARAVSLERLGRFDDAESAFLQLLDLDPDDANVANYLGYLWADRDVRLDDALDLVNRAVAKEPENPAYLDSLGWVHYRLGAMEQAEFWLRRAIELESSDGTLLAHLGEVLLARGSLEEGGRFLSLALDLGCEDPDHVRSLLDKLRDDPIQ